MTTLSNERFAINGVIDTGKNVLENINILCTASSCWATYDVAEGRWSVIINREGASIASFTDNNIIGGINISGTGVVELYNSATIEFPHRDLRDDADYVDLKVAEEDRFPNELDNRLSIGVDCINDPIQAQLIATVELKQSRVDKVIEFRTDYTNIGLKAGDIIDITSDVYGYTAKKFRITRLEEDDSEGLAIAITALEYDEDIYSTEGLVREVRDKKTRIIPEELNEAIEVSNDVDQTNTFLRLLAGNAIAGLLGRLFKAEGNKLRPADEFLNSVLGSVTVPALTTATSLTNICAGQSVTINFGHNCNVCLFEIPATPYEYTITGVNAADINIPLTGTLTITGSSGSLVIQTNSSAGGKTMTVKIGNQTRVISIGEIYPYTYSTTATAAAITEGNSVTVNITTTGVASGTVLPYTITGTGTGRVTTALTGNVTITNGAASLVINTQITANYTSAQTILFTVNPTVLSNSCSSVDNTASITINPRAVTLTTTASPTSITEGASTTITVATNAFANGFLLPYSITGTGVGRVSTALTGNITINSGVGTLTINTIDDAVFQGSQTITLTVNSGIPGVDNTAVVTILDNDPQDFVRQYILTPVVWAGTYDGNDNQLKNVFVQRSAFLPVPFPGEATVAVPLTLSVTKGDPSTITVNSTRNIASSALIGGTEISVITVFDPTPPQSQITGTRVTVYGYY
jgi:hypothetical protein